MADPAKILLRDSGGLRTVLRGFALPAAFVFAIAVPAVCGTAPSSAPEGAAAASPAGDARAFLNRAIAYHREAADLSLSFSASVYDAALDKRDEYKGRLLLKGADKFRLEIPGGTYASDGKDYWEYHARTRQAIRKDAADNAGRPLPAEVLLRFLDSDPISAGPMREDGKEWIGMRLDPARAMKNLDSLEVLLDKSTFALRRVSSRDVSGNEARYTVTSVKRNTGLKDKAFAFTPPGGAEVVDMRGE